jgi:CheY-like chemotaxis protein
MNESVRPAAPLAPVLYTEDDENDAFLMQHAFRRAGITHPLVVLTDGQQAIDYLAGEPPFTPRTEHPLPSLLVLDLNLPLRSGFDVLAWVRQQAHFASLLVVVLSSSNHTKDIDRAYALGANSYFVKPSNVDKRMELVRTLQEKWLSRHTA